MNAVTPFPRLAEDLRARGAIRAEDVLALRRQVFPDGVVSADEAEGIFRLDHACAKKDADWTRFYVDALTDYFVWQSEPRGYVSDAQADMLIKELTRDGRIAAESELELLINIIHWCTKCPAALGELALRAVEESVLTPATAAYGSNRAPAVISAEDVELIRRVIYASGSPGGFTVTREEAELLIMLDNATHGEENTPAWPDLFAKAVANAVMFPRGAPVVPTAEEAFRREKWLAEREGVGALLRKSGKAMAKGNIPFDAIFGSREAREAREREERQVAEALSREAIDAEEARWLLKHFGGAKPMSEGAKRLMAFIKTNSPSIDPAVMPLFAKAGL